MARSGDPKVQALARMRAIATGLLGLMGLVFVAASVGEARHPALAYVRAFAEAGAVGACADWFAVTALFRRPLGLPIPHTGIVPRNKARIGQALGVFIADNFLTEPVLDERLRQLEVARWGGEWLSQPANARGIARRIGLIAPELLSALPRGALRELAGPMVLSMARATPAAPLASRILKALWADGAGQAAIDRAIEWLHRLLADHQSAISDGFARQSHTWLPRWADRLLASALIDELLKLLNDLRDPAHAWRGELGHAVETFIARLALDPELQAQVERLKERLLDDPRLRGQIESFWDDAEARLAQIASAGGPEQLAEQLEPAIRSLGLWLAQDEAAQARLNRWSRLLARHVIAPRRREIGGFVAQVVASWDAKSVVDKLELQVGPDLQYIRINGTLVGGLAGLAIFSLARLFGLA